MALENITFAETIREDILSCAVCFELLSDPRTLPCLHTYCTSCLLSMVELRNKKTRVIRCPECRTETKLIKNGVNDIKSSFFIHSLMEIYNTKRQLVMCTVCKTRKKSKKAVSKCTTCLDGLCEDCSKGHLQSTMTLLHKVVPLKDFASGMYDSCLRNGQKFMCNAHEREMEFYCDTCDSVGCMSCIILDHHDHKYDAIPSSYDSKKDQLKSMFGEVMTKVENIAMAKSKIEELNTITNKKGSEVLKVIAEAGKAVIAAVEKEVAETKQNAENLIQPRVQRLKNMEKDLDEKLKEWRMSIEFCRKILNDGKPVEVLQIVGLLKERLSQLCQADDRTSVPEIEFNTRIMDVHINEAFRENIFLGIFQPEQKLSRGVPVADCSTQTEESMSDVPSGRVSGDTESAESDLLRDDADSGLESQQPSLSVVAEALPVNQTTESVSPTNGNADTGSSANASSANGENFAAGENVLPECEAMSTYVTRQFVLLLFGLVLLVVEPGLMKYLANIVPRFTSGDLPCLENFSNITDVFQ